MPLQSNTSRPLSSLRMIATSRKQSITGGSRDSALGRRHKLKGLGGIHTCSSCKSALPDRCSTYLPYLLKREMLQDPFLNALVQARAPVTIYLANGIRLVGRVESFDQYGLVLSGTSQQFVYKHAISTILPTDGMAASVPAEQDSSRPQAKQPGARPRVVRSPR